MEKSLEFERAVIDLVAEILEKQGVTHTDFGRAVFGPESGVRAWRKCRESETPRKLSLAETHKIAEFLGIDLATMLWQLEREAEYRKIK